MKQQVNFIATACAAIYNAANDGDPNTVAGIALELMCGGFSAGWNAAIDYCMQPVKNGVPAGTAIPSEHTSNTTEPIISETEERVK